MPSPKRINTSTIERICSSEAEPKSKAEALELEGKYVGKQSLIIDWIVKQGRDEIIEDKRVQFMVKWILPVDDGIRICSSNYMRDRKRSTLTPTINTCMDIGKSWRIRGVTIDDMKNKCGDRWKLNDYQGWLSVGVDPRAFLDGKGHRINESSAIRQLMRDGDDTDVFNYVSNDSIDNRSKRAALSESIFRETPCFFESYLMESFINGFGRVNGKRIDFNGVSYCAIDEFDRHGRLIKKIIDSYPSATESIKSGIESDIGMMVFCLDSEKQQHSFNPPVDHRQFLITMKKYIAKEIDTRKINPRHLKDLISRNDDKQMKIEGEERDANIELMRSIARNIDKYTEEESLLELMGMERTPLLSGPDIIDPVLAIAKKADRYSLACSRFSDEIDDGYKKGIINDDELDKIVHLTSFKDILMANKHYFARYEFLSLINDHCSKKAMPEIAAMAKKIFVEALITITDKDPSSGDVIEGRSDKASLLFKDIDQYKKHSVEWFSCILDGADQETLELAAQSGIMASCRGFADHENLLIVAGSKMNR